MKKAKSLIFFLCLIYTASVFSQGQNCNTATPFCDAPGGAGVVFPNNTNNSSQAGPNYGCLTTSPNPAWFYFKTTVAGNYQFNLSQGTTCGAGDIDVDFICWGPFTSPSNCNNLTGTNDVDCSYSPSPTEVIDVNGAPAGQYYIILVTNFANTSGCITLALSATSPPTDCSITCPTVLSGPGIVNFPSTNPLNNVPATPMPSTVACNSSTLAMYATNLAPFGNPIVPGVKIEFINNTNATNSVQWFENSSYIGGFGSCGGCQGLTLNYDEILQFSYMSPSATNQFSFCESNTTSSNMSVSITDLTNNASLPGAPFTWADDGACQTINIPPGTIKGISSWTSTCGSCIAATTDWGAAVFNPAAASVGTHTITYTFNPQTGTCPIFTTSIVITVTNPYNAAFVTPGPFCAGASCATLTPSNTYTLGTGAFSGTGVSGNNFCPATSGVGTFPVTYTIGTSCRATQTNTITVNANPTANAGSPAVLTCTNASVGLTGSGGTTYSWTGPAGGISSGGNTATPTVTLAGTYSVLVANGTCTSIASVAVTQNTATPAVSPAVSGVLNCTTTSVNASATTTSTPVTYNWSGPGITAGAGTGTISVNQGGTYNYTVTSNGCNTIGSQVVSQNTLTPAVTSAVSSVLNCTVASVNASATTTSTPVSYNWSGPGITAGAGTGTVAVNQPGTYNYTVTATNGCSVTGSQAVTQNTVTPAVSGAVSGALNCTITSVNASATTTTTPVTYNWTGPGITAGAGTGTIAINQPGTYNYTLTATNGCSVTGSQAVTQNIVTPVVTPAVNGVLNCTLTSVNASATTTSTPVTYNWAGPGITAGAGTGTVTVNQGGTYNYTITAANGCSVTGSQAVTQNTAIPSVASAVTSGLNCTITSVDASATTTSTPVSYNWSGPSITAGAGTGTVSVNQPGIYNYTVTNTANGCSVTGSQAVTQNTTVPTVNAGTTQTLVCGVASVTLTGSGSAGSSANWIGGVCGTATNYITTACAPGTYTLVATDNASGCTNTSTVSVNSSTNVPQATVNAITNSITCTNSVVAIGVTYSGTDPVTYSWAGPGITGSTTSSVTTANLSGTYNVTITNTSSNCQSVYSAVVPINTTPVPTNVAPSASITCLTNTVALFATPTGTNYAYSWSGPGTITNGTTENPTVNASGNYVVTMTDNINGCVGSFTVNVPSNTIAPTFTLGSASSVTTTCASPNATLSATSSTDPNTVYTWTTPSATTVTGTPISVSAAGIYTVVVTNTVNGCSTSSALSQATVEVIADSGIPVVTLASNSLSITCANPTPSVAVTTTANPVSYNWTPTSGIVPGTETTANPVFTAAGSYSVVVTNTVSSCASSINANVVDVILDNATPVISLSSAANNGTITCTDPQVTITPTITSSTANLAYTWLPGGVTSSTINDATFTSAGVYTLAVTNTLTGCVSSATNTANTFTVYLNNTPPTSTITAISTNSTIGCGGNSSTVTLNASSSSTNFTQTWLPGSATTSTLDVTTAGIYTLVVVDAVSGCSVTTEYTVSGSSTPPQNVDAGTNTSIPCGTPTVALNGTTTSTNVVTYDWSGPNSGSIVSGNTTSNPIVMDAGVYTLTVTDVASGCSATATINVAAANVIASFTANPTSGISPLDVSFTDGSSGATAYSWNFGDSNTSTSQNPNHTFTTGTYTVILTVTSGPCIDTASVVIVVEDGLTLEIPNVFTPNGDGSNDIFHIKSTGVKEISLQIFNRWGQKLYEFAGPKASWDGLTPSGSEVPEGTYFYFVKASGFDGQEIEKHGTVNLFR